MTNSSLRTQIFLAVCGLFIAGTAAFGIKYNSPQFDSTFKSFGVETSGITKFLIANPNFGLIAPALVILVVALLRKRSYFGWMALTTGIASMLVATAAFYLPVFQLSSVV
ncbi:hypothetical protein [Solilutibacter oculi]|uniref:hypothetical protein n=1 Tax=Solilutibacter oculi TaxID=2698682 RepID=UPI0013A67465|nr:hypothetical protein [Lysobacter oculi]